MNLSFVSPSTEGQNITPMMMMNLLPYSGKGNATGDGLDDVSLAHLPKTKFFVVTFDRHITTQFVSLNSA